MMRTCGANTNERQRNWLSSTIGALIGEKFGHVLTRARGKGHPRLMKSVANLCEIEPAVRAGVQRELEVIIERPSSIMHPHDVFISLFRRHLDDWSGHPDWLDVGCGWHFDWPWEPGREKEMISRANVVGIDPDREAINRHRSITKRTVGCIERLPFDGASFDLVTANVVMEHVKYPALALSEIYSVLRPGGIFVFRTPSARNYFVRIARRIPQRPKVWLASVIERRKPEDVYPAYYRLNTCEMIAEICGIVGFRSVHITVTKPRGVLSGSPRLAAVERIVTAGLGFHEGNIIAEAHK